MLTAPPAYAHACDAGMTNVVKRQRHGVYDHDGITMTVTMRAG